MFLWYPVMDMARAPRRTARKKGSGYENGISISIIYIYRSVPKVDARKGKREGEEPQRAHSWPQPARPPFSSAA